jgi:hypothetical protein
MRITCLVATVIFTLFTYLQFNDLNQYGTELWGGWVVLYGIVALVSLISAFQALPRWFYLVGALATLGAAVYRATDIEWEKSVLFNETNPSGNETGGLLIVALWLGFLAWKRPRQGRPGAGGAA